MVTFWKETLGMIKLFLICLLAISGEFGVYGVLPSQPTCGALDIRNRDRTSFPWIAAIVRSAGSYFTYECGGTLVSDRHVITGESNAIPK